MSHIGISPFGICDRVALNADRVCDDERSASDFKPNVVILPTPFSKDELIAGSSAKDTRIGTGYRRPQDACVEEVGDNMSRVLVSTLWDRMLREKTRREIMMHSPIGMSYSASMLLARHIKALVNEALDKHKELQQEHHTLCIPIPSHLDPFQQEFLLRALHNCGLKNTSVKLLWRSVAVGMRWLDRVPEDKQRHFLGKNIITVYLGPDSIELDRLQIDKTMEDKRPRLIPCRTKASENQILDFNGLDAAVFICESKRRSLSFEKIGTETALRQQWLLLNQCPDVWSAVSGENLNYEDTLVDLGKWVLWTPLNYEHLPVSSNSIARTPLSNALIFSDIDSQETAVSRSYYSVIRDRLSKRISSLKTSGDEVAGIIVYGPLSSRYAAGRLCHNEYAQVSSVADVNGIWYSDNEDLATACVDYLDKKGRQDETYYDILPRLNALCLDTMEQKYFWVPLIGKDVRVADGKDFKNETGYLFALKKGSPRLEFFLDIPDDKEGDEKEQEPKPGDTYHYQVRPLGVILDKDVEVRLRVTMRSASGLAKVYVECRNGELNPIDFDYSDMKEKELGKLALQYPRYEKLYNGKGKIRVDDGDWEQTGGWILVSDYAKGRRYLSESFNTKNRLRKFRADVRLLNFRKSMVKEKKNGVTIETQKVYYNLLNYEGESFSETSDLLIDKCIQQIEFDYLHRRSGYERIDNKEAVYRNLTYFYSKTPSFVRKEMMQRLREKLVKNTGLSKLSFCAISRFIGSETKEHQELYFKVFDKLEITQNIAKALYSLFFHDRRVLDMMTRKRANKMLSFASEMVNNRITGYEIIKDGNYRAVKPTTAKSRYRNACLAFYCALLYRRENNEYLKSKDINHKLSIYDGYEPVLLQKFNSGVDKLIEVYSSVANEKYKSLAKYLEVERKNIMDYVNCQGNQDMLSRLLREDDEDDNNEEE